MISFCCSFFMWKKNGNLDQFFSVDVPVVFADNEREEPSYIQDTFLKI